MMSSSVLYVLSMSMSLCIDATSGHCKTKKLVCCNWNYELASLVTFWSLVVLLLILLGSC